MPLDQGHGQVLDGAGGGLGHRRGHVRSPVTGQDHPRDPGALGRAQQRAEVAGVGQPVERQQERSGTAGGGPGQAVHLDRLQLGGVGQHALGGVGAGLGVQLAAADLADGDAVLGGQLDDLVDDRRRIQVVGQPHLPDLATPGEQQLAHRLPALDLVAAQRPSRRSAGSRRTRASGPAPSRRARRPTPAVTTPTTTTRAAPASRARSTRRGPTSLATGRRRRAPAPTAAPGPGPASPAPARAVRCTRRSAATRRAHRRAPHGTTSRPGPPLEALTARSPRPRPSRPPLRPDRRRPGPRTAGP